MSDAIQNVHVLKSIIIIITIIIIIIIIIIITAYSLGYIHKVRTQLRGPGV